MRGEVSPLRLKAAWVVAVGMDALQMFLFPATVEGGFSPLADGLDFIAMAVLWVLVGWHWAFLPSIIVKVIPVMDLAPTWTIALAIASRGLNKTAPAPEFAASGTPKDVTPPDDGRTITVEAKSSPAAADPEKKG